MVVPSFFRFFLRDRNLDPSTSPQAQFLLGQIKGAAEFAVIEPDEMVQ